MTTPSAPVCYICKHFFEFGIKCTAFPLGIPAPLIEGRYHSKPYPNDNGIQFEMKPIEELRKTMTDSQIEYFLKKKKRMDERDLEEGKK
jgi:hypothetical protein